MSYIEIKAVRANGDVTDYAQIENAFQGTMTIWLELAAKYHIGGGFSLEFFQTLWASIGLMSEPDQWVLAATFDRFIVPKEHVLALAGHLRTFVSERRSTPALLQLIAILEVAADDTAVHGICFNQTDAADDLWTIRLDGLNIVAARPYNVHIDKEHTFLTPEYIQSRKEGREA